MIARGRTTPAKRSRSAPRGGRPGALGLFAIPVFLAIYLAATIAWRVPWWQAALYLCVSLVCFAVYAIDKWAAGAGRPRVSERMLLVLGLAGGWPGALAAQQLVRHKSRKRPFAIAFWATVVANVLLFVGLNMPLGTGGGSALAAAASYLADPSP